MALTAAQIPLLQNATATAVLATANATAARQAAAANGPPVTPAKQAAARAAEAAANNAVAAGTALQQQVAASNMDAANVVDAVANQVAAQTAAAQAQAALDKARQAIQVLEKRKQDSDEFAAATLLEAQKKAPPEEMLAKEAKLRAAAESPAAAREAARNALALAEQNLQNVEADTPVAPCPWTHWPIIHGPYVPPKPDAVVQAEAAVAQKRADYDAARVDAERKLRELQSQESKVTKRREEEQRLAVRAQEARDEAALVEQQIQLERKALGPLGGAVNDAQANLNAATVERRALEAVDASNAAAAAAQAQARASYLALKMIPELADLDMKTGAAINQATLLPQSVAALNAFNAVPPTTGQTAKTLAVLLPTLNRVNFVNHMDNEAANGLCVRTPPLPAAANQVKYEYPDGTEVRWKNFDNRRTPPVYSVEVKHTPANPDNGPQDVAFKVDRQGNAIPKNPANVQSPYPLGSANEQAYVDHCMQGGHFSIPA